VTDPVRMHELFLAEAKELTAVLEASALSLEEAPHDRERLNEVFRAAHSLKGAAAMIGLSEIAALTHALETMLDAWRTGELSPGPAHFSALLRSADMLREMIESPPGTAPSVDYHPLAAELEGLCPATGKGDAGRGAPQLKAASAGEPLVRIEFGLRPEAFQWGSDPLLVLREIRGLAAEMSCRLDLDSLPELSALVPDIGYMRWSIELRLLPEVDLPRVKEAFSFFEGAADLSFKEIQASELGSDRADAAIAVVPAARAQSGDAATIRVATDKVDKVIDLMGELMIAQAVVRELVRKQSLRDVQLQEAVLVSDRHLRELQERLMSIRMVPVGAAFSRLPRAARDLTQKLGKLVRLELLGTETELDKTLMDKLADPLRHLVRNALDHGIEPPDERKRQGKPETRICACTPMPAAAACSSRSKTMAAGSIASAFAARRSKRAS
jgi:two-component system chemotaxis sensor kinase CheA